MLQVERFWREAGGCYLSGWLHAYHREVVFVRFFQDEGKPATLQDFSPRPDLLAHYAMLPNGAARAGFVVHLPEQASSDVTLIIRTAEGDHPIRFRLPRQEEDRAIGFEQDGDAAEQAFAGFCLEANRSEMDVLEIGSRIVGMVSESMRRHFPAVRRYVGLDVHLAPGVDIVGDTHELSKLVGVAQFDAIFSMAVLEHLAMPWVAAAEMNRALRLEGITFHRTPQTWPVHEKPNDFWRYTDEGLKILFGPENGFEVIEAGMGFPVTIYPRRKDSLIFDQLPLNLGFGDAYVFARKVAELDVAERRSIAFLSKRYPVRASTSGCGAPS